jgi:GT2 family glycosyltransferase
MASKVIDYDIAENTRGLTGLQGYSTAFVLLRWRSKPIGRILLAVDCGTVRHLDILMAACAEFGTNIAKRQVEELLRVNVPCRVEGHHREGVSVVICTKDRPDDLQRCLSGIRELTVKPDEIIVVDNAPSDERTSEICKDLPVRYMRERRKGLNWARTRGADTAQGEIVAFIDDDAVPDKNWLTALLEPFDDLGVACVTGLVMPLELETDAQKSFEEFSGFSRGFDRRQFDLTTLSPLAAGNVGAGASMAFRRSLVNELGLFRAELDVGTVTQAGGDTYAFYRLMSLGYRIVYVPDALAWHRHRRTEAELHHVLYAYSLATYVYLLRCVFLHFELSGVYTAFYWFKKYHFNNLKLAIMSRNSRSLALAIKQIIAVFASPSALIRSLWRERAWLRDPSINRD